MSNSPVNHLLLSLSFLKAYFFPSYKPILIIPFSFVSFGNVFLQNIWCISCKLSLLSCIQLFIIHLCYHFYAQQWWSIFMLPVLRLIIVLQISLIPLKIQACCLFGLFLLSVCLISLMQAHGKSLKYLIIHRTNKIFYFIFQSNIISLYIYCIINNISILSPSILFVKLIYKVCLCIYAHIHICIDTCMCHMYTYMYI